MLNGLFTVVFLICSNTFMTIAWYGHLKFAKAWWLPWAVLVSWLIALPEYALQVPANRIGHTIFSAPQLKIIQETITVAIFVIFNFVYLGEKIIATDWLAFALILAAVVVMMWPRIAATG